MSNKTKVFCCKAMCFLSGLSTGFLLLLVIFGLLLARHVDNSHEVLSRVWLFAKLAGISFLGGCVCSIIEMWCEDK